MVELVDGVDWKILHLISHDARLPVSSIARQLGLKRETVKYRINKLVSKGVIKHFLTYLDLPKIGYPVWGFMHISFKDLNKESEKEFDNFVKKNSNIIFSYRSLGEWDHAIEFFAKTPQHLYEIQREIKSKFSKIIKDVNTGTIIEVTKINYVPNIP